MVDLVTCIRSLSLFINISETNKVDVSDLKFESNISIFLFIFVYIFLQKVINLNDT